jgi:hypothetical protein
VSELPAGVVRGIYVLVTGPKEMGEGECSDSSRVYRIGDGGGGEDGLLLYIGGLCMSV